jgi:hypothetical protein
MSADEKATGRLDDVDTAETLSAAKQNVIDAILFVAELAWCKEHSDESAEGHVPHPNNVKSRFRR